MASSTAPVAPRSVIETRSIDYIPENERHGSAFGQFTLWLGVNLNITAIVTGALAVVLPAFLMFGKADIWPRGSVQWVELVFLGLVSTALGMYWWNKGACMVRVSTLAVMNNMSVPVGLLINLLFWNQNEPLGRLLIGGLVIVFAVWISRLDRRAVTV